MMSKYELKDLERAANEDNPSVVKGVLLLYPSEVDRPFKGATALQIAARKGNLEVIQILARHGANVNYNDHNDRTPLHYAVIGEKPDAVELLLKLGADMEEEDNNEETPPQIAFLKNYSSCVKKFLDKNSMVKLKKQQHAAQVSPVLPEPGQNETTQGEIQAAADGKLNHLPRCVYCKKDPALVTFEPCGHKVSCIPCSFSNAACSDCGQPFEKASFCENPETMEYLTKINKLKEEVQKVEEQHICYICSSNKINCVLVECGHMFCHKCVRKGKSPRRTPHEQQKWFCFMNCPTPSRYKKIYANWLDRNDKHGER